MKRELSGSEECYEHLLGWGGRRQLGAHHEPSSTFGLRRCPASMRTMCRVWAFWALGTKGSDYSIEIVKGCRGWYGFGKQNKAPLMEAVGFLC